MIYEIIFYLLLLDSVVANVLAWGGGDRWLVKHFCLFSRYFPLARGWAGYYLVLVFYIGWLIFY